MALENLKSKLSWPKMGTWGSATSLITNLMIILQYSRWRIQDGAQKFEIQTQVAQNRYLGVSDIADYEFDVSFYNF